MKRCLLAILVLAAPLKLFADAPRSCPDTLQILLDTKLSGIPLLRDQLKKELANPLFPKKIKMLIAEALSLPHLDVAALTDEIRKNWKISPSTKSFAEFDTFANFNSINIFDHSLVAGYWRLSQARGTPGRTGHRYVLMVPEMLAGGWVPELNLVSALIHELAHIKFLSFLENNKDRLLLRLPPSRFARSPQGIYWIEQSFFTYLTERFAWESERSFLRVTAVGDQGLAARKHFARLFEKEDFEFNLGAAVRSNYKLSDREALGDDGKVIYGRNGKKIIIKGDPSLHELDGYTLREIFLGEANPIFMGEPFKPSSTSPARDPIPELE